MSPERGNFEQKTLLVRRLDSLKYSALISLRVRPLQGFHEVDLKICKNTNTSDPAISTMNSAGATLSQVMRTWLLSLLNW